MNKITLTTKFFTPLLREGYVARPRLLRQIKENFQQNLILISAPAGFGKTTLLSEWVRGNKNSRTERYAWLSLDNKDNAPIRFWSYVIHAVQTVQPELGKVVLARLENLDPAPIEQHLTVFLNEIAQLGQQLTLIMDDYHVIESPEIHQGMIFLIEHLPSPFQLILVTRIDPPWPLARWRTRQWFLELRQSDLRFTFEETAAFLKQAMKLDLNSNDVATLENRTEGWIAGLQMAALSLQNHENPSGFIQSFTGSHRFILDYLLEEVLDRQPPEIRDFLLKTSILKRLCGPLCNSVMAITNSQAVLAALDQKNLFLIPLDEHRQWYRYHHLFADLLNIMLEQAHPGLAAELHRRARAWYEAQELIPDAIDHALAAGETEQAARLVSTNVLALMECDEAAPILQKIDAIPVVELQAHPWLAVAYAWLSTVHPQKSLQLLALSEKTLDRLPEQDRQRLAGHLAAARVNLYHAEGNLEETVHQAQLAEQLLPAEEVAVRAHVLSTWGDILSKDQHDPAAMPILERALGLARQAGTPQVAINAGAALGLAHLGAGRLRAAEQICLDLLELIEDYQHRRQQTPSAASICYTLLGRIHLEKGEGETAIYWGRKSLALSERRSAADTDPLCLEYLAMALVFSGELEKGERLFQRSERAAQKISAWWWQMTTALALDSFLDGEPLESLRVQAQLSAVRERGAEIPPQVQARLLVKEQRPQEALALIEATLTGLGDRPSGILVRLLIQRALAFQALGDEKAALAALRTALEQAGPEERVFPFVREGEPAEKLLHRALAKSIYPEFIRKLLAFFKARGKPRSLLAAEGLIEPLSTRELEILVLLDGPLSTPEIAGQLVISTYTVRAHIKNIYSKLGVHGRSGAVKKAKEFGLLA